MMSAAPCADTPRVLDAISLYHQLSWAHDAGAPLSTQEEEILTLIQALLEPVRGDGVLSCRDVVMLPTNRRVTIAADHRLMRGRVVGLALRTLDIVTADRLRIGERVALHVQGENRATRHFFNGCVVRRGRGRRTRIALIPPPVVDGDDPRE